MPLFSIDLAIELVIAIALLLLPVAYLLIVYRGRIVSVTRCVNKCNEANVVADETMPGVSVVVYTNNDSDNLAIMLPKLLEQDYPAGFEVIVVNDGASETTKDVVTALAQTYSNLYLTYAPEGSRYLSRKKLSLTIGIKAARYDYVLLTRSTCRVRSPRWIAAMARHFAEGKEVVLGHACYDPADDKSRGARTRSFNMMVDAVIYLSSAIVGKPYRGTDANIGYSRKLFFENKGFSNSLNLQYGDDDVFISEISTRENTAVELSDDARMDMVYRRMPRVVYRDIRARYAFTSRFVYKGSRRLFGLASVMAWAWLLLSVVVVLSGIPNVFPLVPVTLLSLILWLPLMFAWKKAALVLGSRKVFLMIPLRVLCRPLHNLSCRLLALKGKRWNFTWENV